MDCASYHTPHEKAGCDARLPKRHDQPQHDGNERRDE